MSRAALSPVHAGAVPAGWRLVPIEPTSAMKKAAADAWLDSGSKLFLNKSGDAVRAAIAAAPSAPAVSAAQPAATQRYLLIQGEDGHRATMQPSEHGNWIEAFPTAATPVSAPTPGDSK